MRAEKENETCIAQYFYIYIMHSVVQQIDALWRLQSEGFFGNDHSANNKL
jgi:hypothetical protein